ncbi:MAG TPA: DUF2085 domain-containing protein [Polyangiaceae bacterium]|nr:DUF2085 domain-containing protein [Polyangiaceae bacterium]
MIGLGPFLPWLTQGIPGLSLLGRAFESWFEYQCHREAARSLTIFGQVMPVCSRCFGIYAGLGLGALVMRPRLDVWPLRIWVGFAALVMVLDVATEYLGMRPEWAPLRLATGILLSYPVAGAVVRAARGEALEPVEAEPQIPKT